MRGKARDAQEWQRYAGVGRKAKAKPGRRKAKQRTAREESSRQVKAVDVHTRQCKARER